MLCGYLLHLRCWCGKPAMVVTPIVVTSFRCKFVDISYRLNGV